MLNIPKDDPGLYPHHFYWVWDFFLHSSHVSDFTGFTDPWWDSINRIEF